MANIDDLQTLCLGHIVPLIPSLLHVPLFHELPYHLRERLFKYIIKNKCLYQFPDVASVVTYFAHEHMEEFDVWKNGRYFTDNVLEKIFGCVNLRAILLRKVSGVSSYCLEQLISRTPFLQKLHLVAIPYLSDGVLAAIGKTCVNLVDLAIVRSDSISDDGLIRYASTCSGNLLKVSLFGCSNLGDDGLTPFFTANPKLLSVNVSRLRVNLSIKSLLTTNSSLTELIIAKCRDIGDSSLSNLTKPPLCESITSLDISTLKLSPATLEAIAASCPNLQTLYLPYCPNSSDNMLMRLGTSLRKLYVARNHRLSDSALANVVKTNPNLEVLNATSCARIGSELLQSLTGECRHTLTTLYFARTAITKASLKAVLESCPELSTLDVCGCTAAVDNEIMLTMALNCKKLEILDISDCYKVGIEGIEHIAKSLSELDSLSMASTFTSDAHARVLAEGVCKKLTTLNISGCYLLTPNFLSYFIKSLLSITKLYASTFMNQAFSTNNPPDLIEQMRKTSTDTNNNTNNNNNNNNNQNKDKTKITSPSKPTHQCLEALFLADWPALCIDDLLDVLPYCLNLETLILSRCFKFDDAALDVIAHSCKSLVYLDISQCENITNTGVCSIAKNCPLLQNFLATACAKIGDPGLEELIARCSTLVELSLSGTRVSAQTVENVTCLRNLSILAVKNTLVARKTVDALKKQLVTLSIAF